LVHYTAQEYFKGVRETWVFDAPTDITVACVTYLSFDAFAAGFCLTDEEFEARLQLSPLYDYAARNRGHHARAASTEVEKLILGFLESEAKVSAAIQAVVASENYSGRSGYSQRVPRQTTGLHLAAYFGLVEATRAILKNGLDPDSKDTKYGQTPLSRASRHGHEAVVKLLLEKDADLETKDKAYGQMPLSWAVRSGREAVVKLLLEKGADPESEDTNGRTPLSWAAESGHEAVVKLLLEKGANLESKDNYGQTPLSWAAESGHEAVVKLLLEKGADLETKDTDSRTPLSWAAWRGHEAVVKLLLEKGAQNHNNS
jgi:ankyrin repeat protein